MALGTDPQRTAEIKGLLVGEPELLGQLVDADLGRQRRSSALRGSMVHEVVQVRARPGGRPSSLAQATPGARKRYRTYRRDAGSGGVDTEEKRSQRIDAAWLELALESAIKGPSATRSEEALRRIDAQVRTTASP